MITPDQKILICNLLAQYKKPRQIMSILKDEHELDVKTKTITKFQVNEKELIGRLRDRFLSTVAEVPIAQKRIRLERAENLYEISQELEGKDRVDSGVKVLATAREEVEGKGSSQITLQQFNQYNQLTDEELQDKIKDIESKIMKTNVVEVE